MLKMITEEDLKVLISEEDLQEGIKQLVKKLNEYYKNDELYVISVLKGSVMFTVDLAKFLTMPVKMEFIKLSSYGSNTYSSGKVKALDLTLPDLSGKNVIISEDIIDSGHTAKFLIDYIKHNYHVESLKFCTLLNKKIRREVDVDSDYSVFEVDDLFLVGYGLDYDGYYRNLPYIGYIEN